MFALTLEDLRGKILDCGGGPASFNAELSKRGGRVVSCDPIYEFEAPDIARRIGETAPRILESTRRKLDNFIWTELGSPERLAQLRQATMRDSLEDFPSGLAEGRYRVAELPELPFCDGGFEMALCSYFLFTYSKLLDARSHVDCIRELCRVAREACIFPLVPQFGADGSERLKPVLNQLTRSGYGCEIVHVPYELRKGGNEMLRVSRR
jgi:hypothetical protein